MKQKLTNSTISPKNLARQGGVANHHRDHCPWSALKSVWP